MITNSHATVYNVYKDPASTRNELYQRTVIRNVEWQNTKASNVRATGGQVAANQAAIFIPMMNRVGYTAPRAWQALVDKTESWTLQVGDIIVRGEVTDEITGAFTITSLKNKYDDVLTIASVDQMDSGSLALKHWEVGAK